MSIKKLHTVKTGDNVSLLASNYQVSVTDIVDANPNIFTPTRIEKSNEAIANGDLVPGGLLIYPGEVLKIPTGQIDDIAQKQAVKADNTDDLAIFINDQRCPNPNSFVFTEYFDTCSDSFQIEYPYDSGKRLYDIDINNFKKIGLPNIKIYIGEDPALTGEIEKIGQSFTTSSSIQSLGGRTKTRLLEKSEALPNVQVDFLNLKLNEIAEIFCKSHGLQLSLESGIDVGPVFEKATRSDSEIPFVFISKLARERRLIVSNTPEGNCLIRKAIDKDPVARFNVNSKFIDFLGVPELQFEFDTTVIFGNYIGKTQTDDDDNATATATSKTMIERSVKRISFKDSTSDQLQGLIEKEEEKSTRNFYKNSIPYPSWIIPKLGRRWKTGDVVTLISPENGITEEKKLIIKQIDFQQDSSDKRTAILKLIPIETYI
ncbi:MAG: LysM peptidoglycan-binding domain-containing protein [Candidatus Helarchaeota archaeon]